MNAGRIRVRRICKSLLAAGICTVLPGTVPQCWAQTGGITGALVPFSSKITDYFIDWFPRTTLIQSEQPDWAAPLATVTPRLLQQLHYDQIWQSQPHGDATDDFGGSRGLELIPWYNVEVILGVPAWIAHNGTVHPVAKNGQPVTDGWADETFLFKYRLFSANAEHGDYILTAFIGFSAPTGDDGNSLGHPTFTPTLAFGKGFEDFDLQSTVGISIPNGGLQRLGMPIAYNTAFQYRIMKFFWPELEVNCIWPNGQHGRKDQVFLTPGVVVGTIPIHDRIGISLGIGYQVSVINQPAYNQAVIFSGRMPF
ncbi:MAG: hypothetical protein JO189_18200 [Deltaproteobacteria bacterium]|nr:hypothetical protein [Deltaproteobacteria bacterium]